jgi:hypothetical protein
MITNSDVIVLGEVLVVQAGNIQAVIILRGSDLFASNGVKIGQILAKEDGYYDFWPELGGGYWPAYLLRAIADMLDTMNKPWDDQIKNDPKVGGPTITDNRLKGAINLLRECYGDYSHPHFTDRHGMADRLKKFLGRVDPL